jgi:uncharacterized protein (TIGR02284 family)
MATTTEHDISVLNGLIATTIDSAEGYREAADDAKNPSFRSMFTTRAEKRREIAGELKGQVRSLGGEPEDDGTVLGSAHRVFLNLKNALAGSDQSIVNEVEAGEDHIKAKYETALSDRELSVPVRDLVTRSYSSIKADHDQMRDIKHGLERLS